MLRDVIKAEYAGEYKVKIEFEDGKKGIVDIGSFSKDGIFGELTDLEYFKKFRVDADLGTICWPHGQDIAPETLYERV